MMEWSLDDLPPGARQMVEAYDKRLIKEGPIKDQGLSESLSSLSLPSISGEADEDAFERLHKKKNASVYKMRVPREWNVGPEILVIRLDSGDELHLEASGKWEKAAGL